MRSIQLFVVLVVLVACLLACVEATATAAGKPQRPQKKGLHKRKKAKHKAKHKAKRAETRAETRARKAKKRAEKRARKAITGKQQGRKLDELDDTTCQDGTNSDNGGYCLCNDGGNYHYSIGGDNTCDCCDCSDESATIRGQTMQCIQTEMNGGNFVGEYCYLYHFSYICNGYNHCQDAEDESEEVCGAVEDATDATDGCLDAANPADVKTFLDAAIANGEDTTQAVLQAWSEAGSCN